MFEQDPGWSGWFDKWVRLLVISTNALRGVIVVASVEKTCEIYWRASVLMQPIGFVLSHTVSVMTGLPRWVPSASTRWKLRQAITKSPVQILQDSRFPRIDVCKDVLPERFDLVIADQVFEHVHRPWAAARNAYEMLRPGGHFLCIVPFLLKVHGYPMTAHDGPKTASVICLPMRVLVKTLSEAGRGGTALARLQISVTDGGCMDF